MESHTACGEWERPIRKESDAHSNPLSPPMRPNTSQAGRLRDDVSLNLWGAAKCDLAWYAIAALKVVADRPDEDTWAYLIGRVLARQGLHAATLLATPPPRLAGATATGRIVLQSYHQPNDNRGIFQSQ
jgi:hypothetical protein